MKARTNVSIDRSLLEDARRYGLKLSAILEDALRAELARAAAARWADQNRDRIAAYHAEIDEHGVLSDEFRSF